MELFISKSVEETEEFAAQFSRGLEPGEAIALCGELGSGKTAFVRGLFAGLGPESAVQVTSPTFTLLHEYPTQRGKLSHLDLYRLGSYREFYEAGLVESVDGKGITVVEWGDKFPELLAIFQYRVSMKIAGENERKIVVDKLK